MKPRCSLCRGALTKVANEPGMPGLYRCGSCGRASRVSVSHVLRLLAVAFVLVGGAVYWLANDLDPDTPSYVGNLIGVLATGALVITHRGLFAFFASPQPVVEGSEVPNPQVPLVRAVGDGWSIRWLFHLSAVITIAILPLLILFQRELGWFFLVPLTLWVLFASTFITLRCPSCRTSPLPWSLSRWPEAFRITACPRCGFKPKGDPRLAEPRTRLGSTALAATYAAALAAAVMLPRDIPPRIEFPPLDAAPKGEAPFDWTIESLAGETVDAASLRGKVIFLNLGPHTWSLPWRIELPGIGRLDAALGSEVFIASVSREPPQTLRGIAATFGAALPLYTIRDGLAELYEHKRLPRTYVIDAAGCVRFERVGPGNWSSAETMAYLRALKAEPRGNGSSSCDR